jgi:imidazolonepropionase-like amidohydrolase
MMFWQTIARWRNLFMVMLGLLCAGPGVVVAADPQPLVLRGGAVFDPITGSLQSDRTIVVEGDRVRSVSGPNVDLPHGGRMVDCRGKYVIPGLIDAHVHLVHLANRSHVVGDQFLPMFLANGVTSVRDAGDAIVAQAVIARAAELRPGFCPRVFLSSPLIDADPLIHRDVGYALTDPAKVRAFVDDMVKWNVTTLKIYAGTRRAVGSEVIKEGHRAGLRVMAHVGAYSAQDAVLDGVDCLEHIWSVFNYIIPAEAAKQPNHRANLDLNNPQAQGLIAALAKRQVNVDPTLVVFRNTIYLNDVEEIHKHPDLARVPRRMLDYWHSYRRSSNLPLVTRETRWKEIRKYQELTGLLHRAGVPLLAGTDTPEPFVPPGYSLHQELQMLVESGLSPAAALAAATINNAKALNQQDRLGTISPGKLADFVILDADPTINILHTRRIHAVVRSGLVCDPATILKAVSVE